MAALVLAILSSVLGGAFFLFSTALLDALTVGTVSVLAFEGNNSRPSDEAP